MMKKENKNDRKEKILRWVNQADLDQIVKEREGLIIIKSRRNKSSSNSLISVDFVKTF